MILEPVSKTVWITLFLLASLLCYSFAFQIDDGSKKSNILISQSIHDKPAMSGSGTFSVLTYNIAGLPEIISSAKTKRAPSIAQIGKRLNRFDIVHVQEDFNYNDFLYYHGNLHAFRTQTKGGVPFGDGLNTLSKYPVHSVRRIPWNNCTGADCLTPKGFTYSRLEIAAGTFIDLYNVHANAYNHESAAAARRDNIKQLSNYIRENSEGEAVILMGDLNAHYTYQYDNVNQLLNINHLKDAWLVLLKHNRLPILVTTLPDSDILSLNSTSESIDKILYRSSEKIKLSVSDYNLERQLFNDQNGSPLSDHHPVSLKFVWTLNDSQKDNPFAEKYVAKSR